MWSIYYIFRLIQLKNIVQTAAAIGLIPVQMICFIGSVRLVPTEIRNILAIRIVSFTNRFVLKMYLTEFCFSSFYIKKKKFFF